MTRRASCARALAPGRAAPQGEWNAGTQHGHGTFTDVDGDRYVGGFSRGAFHGAGKLNQPDGDYYYGNFSEGERVGDGKARVTYASGDVYEGEVASGMRAGYGTYTWHGSRDKYSGGWQADRMHGKGKLKKGTGAVQEGTWDCGEFIQQS